VSEILGACPHGRRSDMWCHLCAASLFYVPVPPQLNVGELDGQCLIDMNNVAVGFVQPPARET